MTNHSSLSPFGTLTATSSVSLRSSTPLFAARPRSKENSPPTNQRAKSQANIVTERNNENATLTARVHTVQQEFSVHRATESATVARLIEEARLAALTQETLVTQKTAAMDRNTALKGQLTEVIQEKATTDTEHAEQVQALAAELQAIRASLSTTDQRIQALVPRTTAQAVEISTSRGTMTSLRASLAVCQRPLLNLPSSFLPGPQQTTHVAPAATPKHLDSVLQANVMMQGRIKEENRQMQQKIRSLTSEVTGLRIALARRPVFSLPPAPTPARLDPPAAGSNGQPSGPTVPANLPSLYEAQHRHRQTLSLTHGTIQSTPTTEESIDSSRSAHLRDETSHGLDHRRVRTTPVSWSLNVQLEVVQHVVLEKRNGNLAPTANRMTPPTTRFSSFRNHHPNCHPPNLNVQRFGPPPLLQRFRSFLSTYPLPRLLTGW